MLTPGGGNGNPFQYSCLGKPTDSGAWRAMVYRIAESDTTEVTSQQHSMLKKICWHHSENSRIKNKKKERQRLPGWIIAHFLGSSLEAQLVKNLPAVQEIPLDSRVGKPAQRRAWPRSPALLPGGSSWTESPAGRSRCGAEADAPERLSTEQRRHWLRLAKLAVTLTHPGTLSRACVLPALRGLPVVSMDTALPAPGTPAPTASSRRGLQWAGVPSSRPAAELRTSRRWRVLRLDHEWLCFQ